MTKYGYTRVSSKSQENNSSLEGQKQQLIENGILEKNILVEVGSAANEIKNLPIFNLILSEVTTLLLYLLDGLKSNPRPFSEHILSN